MRYHRAIESKVKSNLGRDFKYIRINQIRQEFFEDPPSNYLGKTLSEHYKRILEIVTGVSAPKVTIALLNVPLQYLTSICFIDGVSVVIEVTGITEDRSPYASGLICMTGKGGNISSKFRKIFEELQREGHPVKLQQL
jgi:hypothetical protein